MKKYPLYIAPHQTVTTTPGTAQWGTLTSTNDVHGYVRKWEYSSVKPGVHGIIWVDLEDGVEWAVAHLNSKDYFRECVR